MLRNISWGTYIVFCVFLAIGIAFVIMLPETKGRTLEEMDAVFGSRQGAKDAEELGAIQREVGLVDAIRTASGGENVIAEAKGIESTHHEDYKV